MDVCREVSYMRENSSTHRNEYPCLSSHSCKNFQLRHQHCLKKPMHTVKIHHDPKETANLEDPDKTHPTPYPIWYLSTSICPKGVNIEIISDILCYWMDETRIVLHRTHDHLKWRCPRMENTRSIPLRKSGATWTMEHIHVGFGEDSPLLYSKSS